MNEALTQHQHFIPPAREIENRGRLHVRLVGDCSGYYQGVVAFSGAFTDARASPRWALHVRELTIQPTYRDELNSTDVKVPDEELVALLTFIPGCTMPPRSSDCLDPNGLYALSSEAAETNRPTICQILKIVF